MGLIAYSKMNSLPRVNLFPYSNISNLRPPLKSQLLNIRRQLTVVRFFNGKFGELEATYFGGGSGGDGTSSASHFGFAFSVAVATLVI